MSENNIASKWKSMTPQFHALLRIMSALVLIPSGTTILFQWPMSPPGGPIPIMSQAGIGGIIELVGGILLLVGFMTRPAAFLLSGTMAVAFFQFHFKPEWPAGIVPSMNNGSPSVLLCFIYLYLSAAGAGIWSVDAARKTN